MRRATKIICHHILDKGQESTGTKQNKCHYLSSLSCVKSQKLQFTICLQGSSKGPQIPIHCTDQGPFHTVQRDGHNSSVVPLTQTHAIGEHISVCIYRRDWATESGVVTPDVPFTVRPSASRILRGGTTAGSSLFLLFWFSLKDSNIRSRSVKAGHTCSQKGKMQMKVQKMRGWQKYNKIPQH